MCFFFKEKFLKIKLKGGLETSRKLSDLKIIGIKRKQTHKAK